MSDTPETEAAVIASGGDWSPVLRETCRRLERQRDDAQENYRIAMTDLFFLKAKCFRLEQQIEDYAHKLKS